MACASSLYQSQSTVWLLVCERLRCHRLGNAQHRQQRKSTHTSNCEPIIELQLPAVAAVQVANCSILNLQPGKSLQHTGQQLMQHKRLLHTATVVQSNRYTGIGKRTQSRNVIGRLVLGQQQDGQQQQQTAEASSMQSLLKSISKEVTLDSHTQNIVLLRLFDAYRRGMQDAQAGGKHEQEPSKMRQTMQWLWNVAKVGLICGGVYLLFTVVNARDSLSKVMMNDIMIRKETSDVTFADVRGCDSAKKELQDIVSFLVRPESFKKMGARLPRGVLLVGPPGVGKTMLAKAVAGEADVPFFQCSGSQFDEVFVGTGAARVRRLFEEAKKSAPCVVFIDEFDSVGGKRVTTTHHPYANQTVNQLLAEMDGFATQDGVIVLAATNRPEILDSAVTRPGRFDVSVQVQLPDFAGRKSILELYMGRVAVADDVDIDRLAKITMGCSGAELANIVNQAAVIAGLDRASKVAWQHVQLAYNKVRMGTIGNKPQTDTVNLMTAAHESGHTIVSLFTKNASKVNHVTILPRGMSLGHTAHLPEESDQYSRNRAQLLANIDVFMGGQVAEELMFGSDSVTTGCSSDLEQATSIARNMVYKLGMSDLVGVMNVTAESSSQKTLAMADSEVKKILDDSKQRVRQLIKERRPELERLTAALVEYESLDHDDILRVVAGKRPIKADELNKDKSPSDKQADSSWLKSLLSSLNPDGVNKGPGQSSQELKDKGPAPAPGV